MIIKDSGWENLTNHQRVRYLHISTDTSIAFIQEAVKALNDPFGGGSRMRVWIEDDLTKVVVHCMKVFTKEK